MAEELQKQLREVGSKLESLPSTKDALVKLLKQAGTCLLELDQSPSKSMLESMQPFLNAIVKPELLKHQDRDIKLLVATCMCEITRVTAPEAPYSDDILRDIFHLIVTTFGGLSDTSGPSFGRRVVILETLARYRSCVVILDLECNDLVNEMFSTFFSVVSDEHSENVRASMQTIMVVLLEESEDIREDLLLILLSVLGRNKKDVSMAARSLSMNVIESTAVKLEPGIKQFLISSISGDSRVLSSHIDYHEVIYDIYGCAPQILAGVVPYLTGELLTDRLDTRLKAVRLIGDLFALPGSTVSEAFQPIFSEFLKRLTDRAVEIRMSVLEHVKICLLSNPSRAEAPQIISALCDRLLDYDENVRKQVVAVVCDVACHAPTSIPVETAKLVAERLRDKSLLVKKYTVERLAEIHRCYCLGLSGGSIKHSEFDWIPGKIVRCLYDKDFRSDKIESILCESLFPIKYSVKDKVEHWVRVFSGFDKVEVKALEKIMEQKQRLQQEMKRYLSLRKTHQDVDALEFQKKVLFSLRVMSRCFSDPGRAEENFQILDQLKDANVWRILTTLLDSNTGSLQACSFRDDLLKIVGEKHRLYDFLGALSIKCSYLLFSKEHVREILLEASRQKSAGFTSLAISCMDLLVIIVRFSPLLLDGTGENLVQLLKDDNGVIKEGVLRALAKAGGSIQEQLGASSRSVELMLERICLEGSRRQAKYAVHALAAITKDDGLKSLSVLYKKLVDMLLEKMHLPAVLQSLGCVAQTAMLVFETRESEIQEFIENKILGCSNKVEDNESLTWDDRSELCLLKIFSIKTLVKSYLPVKDAHLRFGINKLLGILKKMLSFGEISEDIESSLVDKAHLRLASAKAVLRLSRHWDHKIPVDVFHLTLRASEISFSQAKKLFLNKVYQYIKDRLLDAKYACAFLFSMIGSQKAAYEEEKHNLADIIQMCQQMRARHLSIQSDAKSEMAYPENIISYFVHALAHHSSCPDVEKCKDIKAFELTYRQLHLFLSMLVHGIEDRKSEASVDGNKESISVIISIFQSIKCSEDVVDTAKSKISHAICDLGLLITKRLAGKGEVLQCLTAPVSLSPMLYKSHQKNAETDTLVNEEKSWLADESILSHFESLKLDTNETDDGQTSNDSEGDGNEVPLGKILKLLKAKKSSPAGTKTAVNNVDIFKMVREVNLDNTSVSNKFEPTNGYKSLSSKRKIDKKNQKEKRRKAGGSMSIPVSKRARSSSAPAFKFSLPLRNSKGLLRASNNGLARAKESPFQSVEFEGKSHIEVGDKSVQKSMADPAESDLLVSCFRKNSRISSKHKKRCSDGILNEAGNAEEIDDHDLKKLKFPMESDRIQAVSDFKSPAKKRKRRSIAGLAKCSLQGIESDTTGLIGCRVKVWWPIDKQFYEGVVKSYDLEKKKHIVLYDDGDVEVLRLEKERWELIDGTWNPKRLSPPKSPSKELSSKPEHNFLGGSYQIKKSDKMLRGKIATRKKLKHGSRGVSKSKTDLSDGGKEASSNVSASEPASISDAEDMISGEQIEKVEKVLSGTEESDAEENSVSEGRQIVDSENSLNDIKRPEEERQPFSKGKQVEDALGITPDVDESGMEVESHFDETKPHLSRRDTTEGSDKEESCNPEGNQTNDAEGCSTDLDESDYKTSDPFDSNDKEASDNETLSTWRRRARKLA